LKVHLDEGDSNVETPAATAAAAAVGLSFAAPRDNLTLVFAPAPLGANTAGGGSGSDEK
jgi:hypothetical protein